MKITCLSGLSISKAVLVVINWVCIISIGSILTYIGAEIGYFTSHAATRNEHGTQNPPQTIDFPNPNEAFIPPDFSSVFTVVHLTDLHIKNENIKTKVNKNTGKTIIDDKNNISSLAKVVDELKVLKPNVIAVTGDIIEVLYSLFDFSPKKNQTAQKQWNKYREVFNKNILKDTGAQIIELRGNHEAYGMLWSDNDNFFCSDLDIKEVENGFCPKTSVPTDGLSTTELITRELDYRFSTVSVENGNTVYNFLAVDFTPIPGLPFPYNYYVEMEDEFLDRLTEKVDALEEDNGTKRFTNIILSHYFLGQILPKGPKYRTDSSAGVVDIVTKKINMGLSGHEHNPALCLNTQNIVQFVGPVFREKSSLFWCNDRTSSIYGRLFVFDGTGKYVAPITLNIDSPVAMGILLPPHSSYPISPHMQYYYQEENGKLKIVAVLAAKQKIEGSMNAESLFNNTNFTAIMWDTRGMDYGLDLKNGDNTWETSGQFLICTFIVDTPKAEIEEGYLEVKAVGLYNNWDISKYKDISK